MAACLQVFVMLCRRLSAFQRNLVCFLAGFHFAIVDFVCPTIEPRFRHDSRQEDPQIDKEPANCRQILFRTGKPACKTPQETDKKSGLLSTVLGARSAWFIWLPAALMQEVPLHLLSTLLRLQRSCSQGCQRQGPPFIYGRPCNCSLIGLNFRFLRSLRMRPSSL